VIIAFVSKERLLMKKKTARSEFEREIRADDDVLLVPFCAQKSQCFHPLAFRKKVARRSAAIFRATRFCPLASAYRASEIPTLLLNRENFATGREKKKESRFEIINLSA